MTETYIGFYSDKDGARVDFWLLDGDNDDATHEAQLEWAKSIGGDLPNRIEQAMLWANHRDQFKNDWYWSNEIHHAESGWAWYQYFYYGYQSYYHRNNELRARAVRREKQNAADWYGVRESIRRINASDSAPTRQENSVAVRPCNRIAVLEKLKAQEPVAWQIRNGLCHAGIRGNQLDAELTAANMQKCHDLGGSLAAFNVRPLYAHPLPPDDVVRKYEELLYEVHRKFPDETRHQTALRYIKTAESPSYTNASINEKQNAAE